MYILKFQNDYYLTHNFYKNYNKSGWIFVDESNKLDGNDKNTVIYGHNVRDNLMFGSLKKVITPKWYDNEENYKIKLITENQILTLSTCANNNKYRIVLHAKI